MNEIFIALVGIRGGRKTVKMIQVGKQGNNLGDWKKDKNKAKIK